MTLPSDFDVTQYDRTVIAFSGGKDSLACVLWAMNAGAPNIELWHHEVGDLMDWPCTPAYCRAVAEALDLPIYFSGLTGGFEKGLLKENERKSPTWFETPNGREERGGTRGKITTRRMWPAQSANLMHRWCSSELKIDVYCIALRNQDRFNDSKTLVVTGERAEESPNRARYAVFEPDKTDSRLGKARRHVDRLRPVHHWEEKDVWAIIKEFCIDPHPAYKLGWGRLSCMSCVFGSPSQWATIKAIAPAHFNRIASLEEELSHTINTRTIQKVVTPFTVNEIADIGIPYQAAVSNSELVKIALSKKYDEPVLLLAHHWEMPAGAMAGEKNGPT